MIPYFDLSLWQHWQKTFVNSVSEIDIIIIKPKNRNNVNGVNGVKGVNWYNHVHLQPENIYKS